MTAGDGVMPERPDPFISSDPFWGNTSAWVAVPLIVGCIVALFVISFAIGLALS